MRNKQAKEASRRREEVIACPYQDLFPYINDVIHEKWNVEWNKKNDKLKAIIPDTRPWKENNKRYKQAQSWAYITDPRAFYETSTLA